MNIVLSFTDSDGKIGSAHTMPARILEELEEVISAAETSLGSGSEGEEMKQPPIN